MTGSPTANILIICSIFISLKISISRMLMCGQTAYLHHLNGWGDLHLSSNNLFFVCVCLCASMFVCVCCARVLGCVCVCSVCVCASVFVCVFVQRHEWLWCTKTLWYMKNVCECTWFVKYELVYIINKCDHVCEITLLLTSSCIFFSICSIFICLKFNDIWNVDGWTDGVPAPS